MKKKTDNIITKICRFCVPMGSCWNWYHWTHSFSGLCFSCQKHECLLIDSPLSMTPNLPPRTILAAGPGKSYQNHVRSPLREESLNPSHRIRRTFQWEAGFRVFLIFGFSEDGFSWMKVGYSASDFPPAWGTTYRIPQSWGHPRDEPSSLSASDRLSQSSVTSSSQEKIPHWSGSLSMPQVWYPFQSKEEVLACFPVLWRVLRSFPTGNSAWIPVSK